MLDTVWAQWLAAPAAKAEAEILPCNGSAAWARAMAAQRPFRDATALLAAADAAWAGLDAKAWQQAFASHPRLGEREATSATSATPASLQLSAAEQSDLREDAATREALAEANRVYERRFRRVFLLCATGKSAGEVLAELRARLGNDEAAEWQDAGEQQRRITQLRLRKWLGLPPARCEDV